MSLAGWWKPTADARFFYSDLTASSLRFSKNFDFQSNIEYLSKYVNVLTKRSVFSEHTSLITYLSLVNIMPRSQLTEFPPNYDFGGLDNLEATKIFKQLMNSMLTWR